MTSVVDSADSVPAESARVLVSIAPAQDRLAGLDVARSIALFAMFVSHFDVILGPGASPLWYYVLAQSATVRAAALFVVLAGAGISLMAGDGEGRGAAAEGRSARAKLVRRSLFLFGLGVLNATIWKWDILRFYGIALLLAASFVGRSGRVLWAAIALTTAAFHILLFTLDYGAGWDWTTETYLDYWTVRGFLRNALFNGYYPIFPLFALMLLGIWLGRLDLRSRTTLRALLVGGLLAAVAGQGGALFISRELPERVAGLAPELFDTLGRVAPMPPTLSFLLCVSGVAVAVCAGCLLAAERFPSARAMRWLVPLGQQSLTHYLAHLLV